MCNWFCQYTDSIFFSLTICFFYVETGIIFIRFLPLDTVEIGPYKLNGNVLLAPMAGITDSVFRQLCMRHGAAWAASEMISSDLSLATTAKTRDRLKRISPATGEFTNQRADFATSVEHAAVPHVVQIVGSDATQLAQAARINVRHGAQVIDINMGCPARKVCRRAAGSALLSDERLVEDILEAVVGAVDVPVTLKIRTGPDRGRRNALRIAEIAENAGIKMLAIHGRTRADKFAGVAEYDTIADVKQHVGIPVVANGDIKTPEDAHKVLQLTGADGVMIGRAAQGNPWIFAEINAADIDRCTQQRNEDVPERRTQTLQFVGAGDYKLDTSCGSQLNKEVYRKEDSRKEQDYREWQGSRNSFNSNDSCSNNTENNYKLSVGGLITERNRQLDVLDHVRGLHQQYGEYRGSRIARKHIGWYSRNVGLKVVADNPRASRLFRRAFNLSTGCGEQLALIQRFFDQPESFCTPSAA